MSDLAANPREWTKDQLVMLISEAIKDRDFKAVEALLRLLAVKDGYEAERVYETLKLGVALARANDPAPR